MQRCCELASRAAGLTAPNPLVGSVIVQSNEIVGEGYHPQAGEPHAEIFALRDAQKHGENTAKGATLYVNLEPCNHFGRTPPCSEAVIVAGVRRVVIGMRDPNPQAKGGVETLRSAGIEVTVGVEESQCRRLNEAFIYRVKHRQPFGILKYAMTLDGKIATTTGHSAWISGPASRQQVHRLRSRCEAVIVGGNTVRRDNPNLTSHGESEHNPLRVVMSRRLDLPVAANLWNTEVVQTLVFTQTGADLSTAQALRQQGIEVVELELLTPKAVMSRLYDRGCMSVLWECGGTLAAAAIADGSVQKLWAFIAPKLIGGAAAPSPLGDLGLEQMSEAIALENLQITQIEQDFLLQGYLKVSPPVI
ncbi:MAG: bifunctional diaminohydroxyphosphoribosylaminopyrimidine deaminase/5-amino-6-(5-phosphoribosylamino)uracil reductase RibD [Leptolyngbya foveolarum]|uniref:Riboflavin biosynthesis protein RibD n=1 Tax=Leptolyngbya foveolarum TaxID=47253 RepID=A0A2W4UMX9_9CYAN|nr:MAG: bifunctional diaminohydroxyphosphoribosylaminopyrimidine deaminase/5-amino-6-(5-phosphoribosylamino)uracil reductase RibD [Leptolyngbya foveolarum]